MVSDQTLHGCTGERRVVELVLDVVDQLKHSQAHSQRVDVLLVDRLVRRLLEHHIKDFHELLSLVLLHEGLEFLDQSDLDLVFGHVEPKLVLKDLKNRKIIDFQQILQEYFGYLEGNIVLLK